MNKPKIIVNIDPKVEMIIMFPASLIFPFIAAAITKLAIAVGLAKTRNKIARSVSLIPM